MRKVENALVLAIHVAGGLGWVLASLITIDALKMAEVGQHILAWAHFIYFVGVYATALVHAAYLWLTRERHSYDPITWHIVNVIAYSISWRSILWPISWPYDVSRMYPKTILDALNEIGDGAEHAIARYLPRSKEPDYDDGEKH